MTPTGNKTGNKLSKTGGHSEAQSPMNPGPINRAIRHLVGWGPGGRRFKSCLPDDQKAHDYGPSGCLRRALRASWGPIWGPILPA